MWVKHPHSQVAAFSSGSHASAWVTGLRVGGVGWAPPCLAGKNESLQRHLQKGLLPLDSLIKLAMVLGYKADIKNLFSKAQFDTMAELDMIRRKSRDKRAYPISKMK